MAGETSKTIGELGEDLSGKFIQLLGWVQRGSANVDFDCASPSHKTPKGRDKTTHGVDIVCSYANPYREKLQVVIVEAKAVSWRVDGVLKTEGQRILLLDDYLETLKTKISCARKSANFRELFDLKDIPYDTYGAIIYYVHDGFSFKEMAEIYQKVPVHREEESTLAFVLDNRRLDLLYSMLRDIEANALKNGAKMDDIRFFYPELQRKSSKEPWLRALTLESIFSGFITCRIQTPAGHLFRIYYFGTYSADAIRRFCSAIGHFQIYSHEKLTFIPLTMEQPQSESSAIKQFFVNNQLRVDGRDVSINIEKIDRPPLEFSLPR